MIEKKRKLGASDVYVSPIMFGAWAIGGWMWGGSDENESIRRHSGRHRCRHNDHRHRRDLWHGL